MGVPKFDWRLISHHDFYVVIYKLNLMPYLKHFRQLLFNYIQYFSLIHQKNKNEMAFDPKAFHIIAPPNPMYLHADHKIFS